MIKKLKEIFGIKLTRGEKATEETVKELENGKAEK